MIWLLPVLAAAGADWFCVTRSATRCEYVFKPLTLILLTTVAAAHVLGEPATSQSVALLAALTLSLAGDVFLMLPTDGFVPGLASFLAAHVAYIVVFAARADFSATWLVAAMVLLVVSGTIGMRIMRGLRAHGRSELVAPVGAYMLVISAMVLTVMGTLDPWAVAGALLFYASDALIGWSRFVRPAAWAPLAIMVTYHLGQIGLVVGALDLA